MRVSGLSVYLITMGGLLVTLGVLTTSGTAIAFGMFMASLSMLGTES